MNTITVGVIAFAVLTRFVAADIVVPGADGSDGDLIVSSNLTIDLSKAWAGDDKKGVPWDTPGGDRDGDKLGDGVYDPEKWAIVFKWNKVEIKSGATVTFINHPANPPVVWLVTGDVKIDGAVSLDGGRGHNWNENRWLASAGPGAFRGGPGGDTASDAAGGFGPGGAGRTKEYEGNGTAGSYSYGGQRGRHSNRDSGGDPGPAYGNPSIMPLIGGSGAAGGLHTYASAGGAGGAGAILIASPTEISLGGTIRANGGQGGYGENSARGNGGGGAGGAIRLISNRLTGAGRMRALYGPGRWYDNNWHSGWGAHGRLRVETNDANGYSDRGDPPIEFAAPGETAKLWPEDTGAAVPSVRVIELGGRDVPADPRSQLSFPLADVSLAAKDKVKIRIAAENVPLTWKVTVRTVPKFGQDVNIAAAMVEGDDTASIWEAELSLLNGFSAIQVRAAKP